MKKIRASLELWENRPASNFKIPNAWEGGTTSGARCDHLYFRLAQEAISRAILEIVETYSVNKKSEGGV